MKPFIYRPALLEVVKNYNKSRFMTDLMAGLIVGIVALPLAIAFGIASGVTPEKGIITAIVAGVIISMCGGSKVQIGGPTGAFIVIVYGIIQSYGMAGLTIATLMAGAFLVLMGLLKLGTIIKFIPYPIVVGFTSGIALTIFTTQVKDLLGLQMPEVPAEFVAKWVAYAHHLSTIDIWSTVVGILSVAIIALWPKVNKTIPGSLVAIIAMTVGALLLKAFAGITSVETIGDRFAIQATLPTAEVPDINWAAVRNLIGPAITIAVLGAIESLLSATVADGVISERHDSNSELVGQGLANLVTPLFGGIPATGAIARTMTNINNGGRSPIAGIVHAVVLLLIFLFLMPLAQYIPMACLAGVLVMVAYGMSGWRTFAALLKTPKSDVVVLFVTFLLTVFFDLTIAIEVGLVIACLAFMRRMAESSGVSEIVDDIVVSNELDVVTKEEPLHIPEGVQVYEINGPFFFGAGNQFEDLMEQNWEQPKVRIIRMRRVPFIDSTGIHNLSTFCERSQKMGITVVLSGVVPKVKETLLHAGFYALIGEAHICAHINDALQKAEEILKKE